VCERERESALYGISMCTNDSSSCLCNEWVDARRQGALAPQRPRRVSYFGWRAAAAGLKPIAAARPLVRACVWERERALSLLCLLAPLALAPAFYEYVG